MHYVYLAGPITGLPVADASGGWRRVVRDQLSGCPHIEVLSPMRLHDPSLPPSSTWQLEFERDVADIDRCTCMLVGLKGAERVSIGTIAEMGMAKLLGRPIIVVMENGGVHEHPWVRTILPTYVTDNLKDALQQVRFLCSEGL